MLPPAILPASSAFQRLAAAGKCKKIRLFFVFLFSSRDMSRSKNVRLQRKNFPFSPGKNLFMTNRLSFFQFF
jgi:hypothetical protein